MWRRFAAPVFIATLALPPAEGGVAVVVRTRVNGAASNAFCNFALGVATNAGGTSRAMWRSKTNGS